MTASQFLLNPQILLCAWSRLRCLCHRPHDRLPALTASGLIAPAAQHLAARRALAATTHHRKPKVTGCVQPTVKSAPPTLIARSESSSDEATSPPGYNARRSSHVFATALPGIPPAPNITSTPKGLHLEAYRGAAATNVAIPDYLPLAWGLVFAPTGLCLKAYRGTAATKVAIPDYLPLAWDWSLPQRGYVSKPIAAQPQPKWQFRITYLLRGTGLCPNGAMSQSPGLRRPGATLGKQPPPPLPLNPEGVASLRG